ncbi:hypothetical protein MKW92_050811 [Papaver armeniacum]|nr:hypothetical protein MKW92_050811 [Papaver armeniacum]
MDVDDSDKYWYSESDDDDSDDTDTLMAELIKVKEAKLISGNPLVSNAASFTVKRRWDDDLKHPSVSSTTRSGMTSIENSWTSI